MVVLYFSTVGGPISALTLTISAEALVSGTINDVRLGEHLRTHRLVPILPIYSVEDAADDTIEENPNLLNFAKNKG